MWSGVLRDRSGTGAPGHSGRSRRLCKRSLESGRGRHSPRGHRGDYNSQKAAQRRSARRRREDYNTQKAARAERPSGR